MEKTTKPAKTSSAPFLTACFLLGAVAGWLLSSCSTPQGGVGSDSGSESGSDSQTHIFPINVLLYSQPVGVGAWTPDPAKADNSEGAALNVVTAMQRGDVDGWLDCWAPDERPQLTPQARQNLLDRWAPLKGGQIFVVGRVVDARDLIEEVSVRDGQANQTLQIPLKKVEGRWLLTRTDASDDEYLHWQNSPKKLVEPMDPNSLREYLHDANAGILGTHPTQ